MRLLATLLLLVATVGCASESHRTVAATPPASGSPSTSGSAASSGPAPPASRLHLTRAAAGHLLRDLAPLTGFRASTFCLNGPSERCALPSKPRWSQYVEWQGGRFAAKDRSVGRDFVLVAVLAHANHARAAQMVEDVRRRSVRGRIDEPVRGQEDSRVGRRGHGQVSSVQAWGWRGVASVARVRLLYREHAPVRGVVQVDTAVRRGRFGVQVIGWVAHRPGESDPAARLEELTRQVLLGLGADYPAVLTAAPVR